MSIETLDPEVATCPDCQKSTGRCAKHSSYTIEYTPSPEEFERLGSQGALMGWMCPCCRRCYSPFTKMCDFCGPQTISVSSLEGTINLPLGDSSE